LKELDDIHNQVGRYALSCTYESKADLLKKIANKDFDAKQSERITKEEIPVCFYFLLFGRVYNFGELIFFTEKYAKGV
jgi:hypothetical protein